MNTLTTFERALLAEFETLAAACERSGNVSADTAVRLSQVSKHFSGQIAMLRERQTALEERLNAAAAVLDAQSDEISSLLRLLNRFTK